MTPETLKIANELKAAIEDRKNYGNELENHIKKSENPDVFEIFGRYYNNSSTKLRDINAIDILQTAIARNDREIKKLEKQFENLK